MTQYQETKCGKNIVWMCALTHLREFIKKAFADTTLLKTKVAVKTKTKKEKENKDYTQEFIRYVKSGLTLTKINKILNIPNFKQFKEKIKNDESIKEMLGYETYFNLFELTETQYKIKILLDKGLTHGKIRKILCMNKKAFEAHERRIRRKLGLPVREYNKKY